ncbi:hypothetical protein ACWGB8_15995 [Kitasatospora sp. NPDC054939]
MTKLSDILTITPEALAAAGLADRADWAGPRPKAGRGAVGASRENRWDWQWSPELAARLVSDPGLQQALAETWTEHVRGAPPVRLALHGVARGHRHTLVTRLGQLRPTVGAVFVADETLEPAPRWQWPLRVCAVTVEAAEDLVDVLQHDEGTTPPVDGYTLGEEDGDCDVLAVSGAADLVALTRGGGLSATCLVWCTPEPPDKEQLLRLDEAARHLGASGWIVADLSTTTAADWLDRLVRDLSGNVALDEAADNAGSWLTVAHPELVARHAVSDSLREADSAARALAGSPADTDAEPLAELTVDVGDEVTNSLHLTTRPTPVTEVTHRVLQWADDAGYVTGRWPGRAAASALRDVRRAGVATGRANARHLQALVSDQETGARRRSAFRAGAVNDVHIRVGPGSAEWHAPAAEFPEHRLKYRGGEARLLVTFDEDRDMAFRHDPLRITLPQRGASSEAVFPVTVGPDEREIRCTARVYYENRQLQRLEITGPVNVADEAVADREITVHGEAFSPLADPPGPRRDDPTAVIRITGDDEAVISTGAGVSTTRIPDLDQVRARIREHLGSAVDTDSLAVEPRLPPPDRLLCRLAQQGSALFEQLETTGHGALGNAGFLQAVSAEAAELWPLEFVYDFGYPRDGARLCTGWKRALETGSCSCRRPDHPTVGGRRTVCPLGFWGLRMVIERRVERTRLDRSVLEAAPPDALGALRPVDSVLFAASDIVRTADREATARTLRASFGEGLHTATSWQGWRDVVRTRSPALLLAVPHNARDEGDTPVLQIGRKGRPSRLPSVQISRRDIVSELHGDGTGPIVMLLGCNTAQEDVRWQNVAARFLQESAPVVVGTLVPTLGRQAAAMASTAAVMLAENSGAGKSIGELVRDIRRRLLALGYTLAMAVVAFGDARWLVGNRKGDEP